MAVKVPNVGEQRLLSILKSNWGTLTFKLFKNDYTPVNGSVLGDFTEANFTGYASQDVAAFGAIYNNADDKAETDGPIVTFTQTGTGTTNTVYGYYVIDAGGNLLWAERNPNGGVAMNTAGSLYNVWPRFTLSSES